jgi:hypothetical protein
MRPVTALAAAVPAAGVAAYAAVVHHVGAPQLPWTCPSYDFVSRWWVPGNGPADVNSVAEVHWLGSTEIAGCSQSITIGLNTVPHQGLAGSLLDRFVYGTHEHNLMGAITGLFDQPDGKYVFLAVAMFVLFMIARIRRAAA